MLSRVQGLDIIVINAKPIYLMVLKSGERWKMHGEKYVCPRCHRVISKSNRRRHRKKRCGELPIDVTRFRIRRTFNERGLRNAE